MAQPWASTNSTDTKAVMDDILGNLNRELAALSNQSRTLLNNSQPRSSVNSNIAPVQIKSVRPPSSSSNRSRNSSTANSSTTPANSTAPVNNVSQPYVPIKSLPAPMVAHLQNTTPRTSQANHNPPPLVIPAPSAAPIQQASIPSSPTNLYNNFPDAPPPSRVLSQKNNNSNDFPPPPPANLHQTEAPQNIGHIQPISEEPTSSVTQKSAFQIDDNLDDLIDSLQPSTHRQPAPAISPTPKPAIAKKPPTPTKNSPNTSKFQLTDMSSALDDLDASLDQLTSPSPAPAPAPQKIYQPTPQTLPQAAKMTQDPLPPPVANLAPPTHSADPEQIQFSDRGIKVYGPNTKSATLHQNAEFFVDLKKAGSGKLSGGMVGPADASIKMEPLPENLFKIGYLPTEPGNYTITLKFEGNDIPGSPFDIVVAGSNNSGSDAKPVDSEKAVVGRVLNFGLKLPNVEYEHLKASIINPHGTVENLNIENISFGSYNVKFKPAMVGFYRLNILYNDKHISGSPYDIEAEEPKLGKAGLCTATGTGLSHGSLNVKNHFKVDTTNSGGIGNISIELRGPSKPEIEVLATGDVSYTVSRKGTYNLTVKFNEENINGSPFTVTIE